jgi:hypothetical protein
MSFQRTNSKSCFWYHRYHSRRREHEHVAGSDGGITRRICLCIGARDGSEHARYASGTGVDRTNIEEGAGGTIVLSSPGRNSGWRGTDADTTTDIDPESVTEAFWYRECGFLSGSSVCSCHSHSRCWTVASSCVQWSERDGQR